MTMKTILVHLADDADCAGRLRAALAFARHFGAHVSGVYTSLRPELPPVVLGRGASLGFVDEVAALLRKHAAASESMFRKSCDAENVPHDWRHELGDPTESLARRLHYADIAFVSQSAPNTVKEAAMLYLSDHLAMVADGPVVVMPHGAPPRSLGHVVLIGWKPCREAGRAVRDALPVLAAADRVAILTVGAGEESRESGAALAARLKRQGIAAEPHHRDAADNEAAAALLDEAGRMEADLVVIGAYGRSRLRELVLGGVTRHMLAAMRVPVLMSH
jgi:nucleotide-binding universal stress UspA family protein